MLLFTVGCGETGSGDSDGGDDSTAGGASQDTDNVTAPKTDVAISPKADNVIPPKTDSDVSPKTDAVTETTVTLLDPGAEPRTALRYKFQANRSDEMAMEMKMAMAMEMGGQKMPETQMPTMLMTMTIDAGEVSPEGDLRYDFELSEVEVVSKPGENPMMVSAMKQQVNSMKGMTGAATVTSRGFSRDAEIKLPAGVDAQSKQVMDNMRQSINQMSAPLPEEPVGKGARWQVTMPMDTPAMKFTQIATYTLTEIDGDKVKCDVAITQSAPPQDVNAPGLPPGMKVSLKSLDTSGTGTIEMQMTDLVPTSNVKVTTINVVVANEQEIKTTTRVETSIHP